MRYLPQKIGFWCVVFPLVLSSCGENVGAQNENCALAQTAETSGKELGINDTIFGGDEVAQSFTLSEQKKITSVKLKLQKVGMDTGSWSGYQVALRIVSDSSGKPGTTAVSASDATVDVTFIHSTANFYTFTFGAEFTLNASTTYWLRARGTYPASTSNFIKWLAHDGTGGYDNGIALVETGSGDFQSSLIGDLRDLIFKLGC